MSVQDDIANILYADDPDAMLKYNVQKKFFPFSGQTQEQIMLTMTQNYVTTFDKVLYNNYGGMYDRIEIIHPEFYLDTVEKQWGIIQEYVNGVISELDKNKPTIEVTDIEEEEENIDETV